MNRSGSYIFFVMVLIAGFLVWSYLFSSVSKSQPVLTSPTSSVQPVLLNPTPSPLSYKPIHLLIPVLNVSAEVEGVGLDDKNRMDVPKNVDNVAWYKLGSKPGEVGNAVFAAHFDKPDGSPAIFYKLDSLKTGDKIEVVDQQNQTQTFIVTEKRVVDLATFPLQEVFGPSEKLRVNLITCGGVWDKTKKEYSKRTVIFSELKTS